MSKISLSLALIPFSPFCLLWYRINFFFSKHTENDDLASPFGKASIKLFRVQFKYYIAKNRREERMKKSNTKKREKKISKGSDNGALTPSQRSKLLYTWFTSCCCFFASAFIVFKVDFHLFSTNFIWEVKKKKIQAQWRCTKKKNNCVQRKTLIFNFIPYRVVSLCSPSAFFYGLYITLITYQFKMQRKNVNNNTHNFWCIFIKTFFYFLSSFFFK